MLTNILGYLGLVSGVYWLVRQGFFRKAGSFLSWPMFNQVSYVRARLYDSVTRQPVNIYSYQIHIEHGGDARVFEEMLLYLHEVDDIQVDGHGVVAHESRNIRVRIRGGHVDYF